MIEAVSTSLGHDRGDGHVRPARRRGRSGNRRRNSSSSSVGGIASSDSSRSDFRLLNEYLPRRRSRSITGNQPLPDRNETHRSAQFDHHRLHRIRARRNSSWQDNSSTIEYDFESDAGESDDEPSVSAPVHGGMVFWGWIILILTWILFVVGIGSVLGIWTWAWDVGEAPHILELDPTLPIQGYYPALAILAIVMAWVWVIFAWLGMKYFRHSKVG